MEVSVVLLLAYLSYVISEMIKLSGIMSLFITGVCMKHYAWYTLSDDGKTTTKHFFKMVATLSEIFVFVYVGLNVFSDHPDLTWDPWLIFYSILLIFIARFCNIFPLTALANIRRKVKVNWRMQVILWFAGLRGAIAFALSLNMTTSRNAFVTTTLFIVLFTTLVLGCLTAPLLKKLKLQQTEDEVEATEGLLMDSLDDIVNENDEHAEEDEAARIEKARKSAKNVNAFHRYWRIVDER